MSGCCRKLAHREPTNEPDTMTLSCAGEQGSSGQLVLEDEYLPKIKSRGWRFGRFELPSVRVYDPPWVWKKVCELECIHVFEKSSRVSKKVHEYDFFPII